MKKITQPMTLKKSQVKQIPISKLKVPDLSISEENAIVGYFDILGYSFKTDWKDSKHSVLDFSGALLLVAKEYPHLKINVFSDNAFVYTKIENVKDFFAGIRFAFDIWVQNGVLVRAALHLAAIMKWIAEDIVIASQISLNLSSLALRCVWLSEMKIARDHSYLLIKHLRQQ